MYFTLTPSATCAIYLEFAPLSMCTLCEQHHSNYRTYLFSVIDRILIDTVLDVRIDAMHETALVTHQKCKVALC